MSINLIVLPETFAVVKLDPSLPIPEQIYRSSFYNISRSSSELSVLCEQKYVTKAMSSDLNWRLLKYHGSLDADESGIVLSVITPLALAGISVVVYTAYENGYFGVSNSVLDKAISCLLAAGYSVQEPSP